MESEGPLIARVYSLDQRRRGYLSVLSRVCNEVERLTTDVDYADVDLLKSRLQNAWSQYEHCCGRYFALLDDNCEKYNEVKSQYLMQRSRELYYEEKLQQICQECQPCHASSRTTTKPIIQSSEAAECAIHIEMKTLEIEIKKKELELELTRLESELEETKRLMGNQSRINLLSVCSQVREQSDCASPTHDVKTREEVPLTSSNQNNPLTPPSSIFSSTSSSTHAPFTPPASSFPSTSNSTDIPWSPPVSIPRSTSTERTATGFTPPMSSFRSSSSSTVRHPVSQRNPPFSFDVLAPQTPQVSSVLSAPVFTTNSLPQPYLAGKPPYASTPIPATTPMVTDPPQSRNVSGLLPPNHYGGAMTTNTPLHKVSTEYTPDRNGKPSSVKDESIFTTIASAIANISLTQDLPKIQVQKFDGSPERFPTFRQRFRQLVEARALDDAVKMTLLLQFLEGPALKAVQRYEALPGGLTSALKTLEERFGRPSQVVRACVDALTKGPVIQNNDRQALQQLADDAQVAYDTLESMGYLREINTDNLERIVARLPKWAQTKFIETVNKKRKDKEMPSFKDVVEFLKDRADVMNHPFFSKSETATKIVNVNPSTRQAAILRERSTPSVKVTTLATSKKDDQCFMCSKPHRLYRCELFKSKNPKERNEFVKAKKICFNCLSSTEHNYKNCKCSTRCQVSGCGKVHHSMLHFTDSSDAKQRETSQPETKRYVNDSVNTTAQSTTSTTGTNCTIAVNNQEVMLQVLPVKIINDEESDFVTTYCLIDSGSDVTLIDPSLAKKMNLKGTPGNLVLNTVSNSDVSNQATKVSFKLACLSEEEDSVVNVETAWAIKELAIPIKHMRTADRFTQWPHLKEVPFPDVERRKISILLGTNVSQAFVPMEVRRGNPNEPIAIKCCLGWSILGGANNIESVEQYSNSNFVTSEEMKLSHQLQEFWRVESYGTESNAKPKTLSIEDQQAMKIIKDTTTKKGDHYQMGLLWKEEDPSLPYNRVLAEARLQHLKKRFQRDPELETKYRDVINNYVAKGYARKLSAEEAYTKKKS